MYYAGIDYHKRYSVVNIQDARGTPYVTRTIAYRASLDLSLRSRAGRLSLCVEIGVDSA